MLWILKWFKRHELKEVNIFEPTGEPDLLLYKAAMEAYNNYAGNDREHRELMENVAIKKAATRYAIQHDLKYPTLAQVCKIRMQNYGKCEGLENTCKTIGYNMINNKDFE